MLDAGLAIIRAVWSGQPVSSDHHHARSATFRRAAGEALVTLLLGDGQLGRRVRQTAGVGAGLV